MLHRHDVSGLPKMQRMHEWTHPGELRWDGCPVRSYERMLAKHDNSANNFFEQVRSYKFQLSKQSKLQILNFRRKEERHLDHENYSVALETALTTHFMYGNEMEYIMKCVPTSRMAIMSGDAMQEDFT